MDIFPTQYSTLSSAALKDRIEESFDFSNLTCRLLLHGVSDTYILDGQPYKYVLKVYRQSHRSLNEIKGEVELLRILTEGGAKVAYAIPDKNGELIQAFNAAEGIRHGVLFSFAPGASVYDLTDHQLRVVGHEMAFNHNITSQITLPYARKPYSIQTTLIQPLAVLKPAFQGYPEGYAYLESLAQQAIKKMDTFDTSTFSQGYCHYDYLPKNFHFDKDDNLTLFDFDFAGPGLLASDVASFLVHFFFHTLQGKISTEEARRQFGLFINGYREVRPLADAEVAAVPSLGIMFWIFYLGFAYENFDDWSNSFFGPRYLRERVALIKSFADMYCRF